MPELDSWDITAANNNSAPPDGWPENTMNYSEVNNTAREGMAVVARFWKDINGSNVLAGPVNAYTITLNAGYVAYFDGLRFTAEVNVTNTGGVTLNVNAIGVITVVNTAGAALGAGDLQAGGKYEFIYDGTNFQLLGDVSGGSLTADVSMTVRADIVTATPPTSEAVTASVFYTDMDGSDALGSMGYNGSNIFGVVNNMHGGLIAFSGESSAGTSRNLLVANPDAGLDFYWASTGVARAGTGGAGNFYVRSDANTDAEVRRVMFEHQDGTDRGWTGYASDDILRLTNLIHGGAVRLSGEDAGGTTRNILNGDPDGQTTLYAAGVNTLAALTGGEVELRSVGSTDTEARRMIYAHQNGTNRAYTGFISDDTFTVRSLSEGGHMLLQGENAGGSAREFIRMDPDGTIQMRNPSDNGIRLTLSSAGAVLLHSTGNTDAEDRELRLTHADGTARAKVGHSAANAVLRFENLINSGEIQLMGLSSAAAARTVFWGDPDSNVILYYDGSPRFYTNATGIEVRSAGNTDTENRLIELEHNDGTRRAYIGYAGSGSIYIGNEVHGGQVLLVAEDSGGTSRTLFQGNPDSETAVSGDTDVRVYVNVGAENAIWARANGAVELYHNNILQFQTQQFDATGNITGVQVKNHEGTMVDAGVAISEVDVNPSSFTLSARSAYDTTVKNNTTAITITCEASGTLDFPVGASHDIYNRGASGNITIADGATALIFLDGSSSTDVGANCTLAPGGACTIYREAAGTYLITGLGITV